MVPFRANLPAPVVAGPIGGTRKMWSNYCIAPVEAIMAGSPVRDKQKKKAHVAFRGSCSVGAISQTLDNLFILCYTVLEKKEVSILPNPQQ